MISIDALDAPLSNKDLNLKFLYLITNILWFSKLI